MVSRVKCVESWAALSAGRASDELAQPAVGGERLHHLAGPAFEQGAGGAVATQEGGGLCIIDAETLKQYVGGVAAAGEFTAVERDRVCFKCLQLRLERKRCDAFR